MILHHPQPSPFHTPIPRNMYTTCVYEQKVDHESRERKRDYLVLPSFVLFVLPLSVLVDPVNRWPWAIQYVLFICAHLSSLLSFLEMQTITSGPSVKCRPTSVNFCFGGRTREHPQMIVTLFQWNELNLCMFHGIHGRTPHLNSLGQTLNHLSRGKKCTLQVMSTFS